MSRRPLRALLLSALLVLVSTGQALAGQPTRSSTDRTVFPFCDALTADGAVVLGAGGGDNAGIAWWPPGADPADPPTAATLDGLQLSTTDTTMTGRGTLVDVATGAVVGEASFALDLRPDGPAYDLTQHRRRGNHVGRMDGWGQFLLASGTVRVLDASFPIVDCAGVREVVTTFANNPHALAAPFTSGWIDCDVTAADGHRLELGGDAMNVSFVVYPPGADVPSLTGFAHDDFEGLVTRDRVDMVLLVHDAHSGAALPHGSATGTAAPVGDPERFTLVWGSGRERLVVDDLTFTGTIAVTDDATFDLAACTGTWSESFVTARPPSDRVRGPVPANDAPSGAAPLRVGSTANQQTGGAAWQAEAQPSCLVDRFDPEVPVPATRTVWYVVMGTGGPVTVDTAGSDFDTAVSVHVGDDLAEHACGDDTATGRYAWSLQAAVTFPTKAGVPYLVQVGGAGEQHGRVRVAAR